MIFGVEYAEVARSESERGELVLRRRDADGGLELRANGVFVMDTVEVGTERALARAALDVVTTSAEGTLEVMIGGLGLGFTAHEVLADPRVATCTVVEIEQALVDWMRDGTVPHGPGLLADARLAPVVADLAVAVAEARDATYDLVLMDVDNGPGYLVHDANATLYAAPFLADVRRVLRPGGVVSVWSADEAPDLEAALHDVFGAADAHPLAVRLQDRDEHYWLYSAVRAGSTPS